MSSRRLTIQQRKEVFRDLVATQDQGTLTIRQSAEHVAKLHGITEAQLRQIEEEGLEKEWPPLDEAIQAVG